MKKYLIRVVGSLCILAAIALLFMAPLIQVDNVKSRDMRAMRNTMSDVFEYIEDSMLDGIEDEDFQGELEDCDLPHTKGSVKKHLRKAEDLTKRLIDDSVSIQELLILSLDTPALVTDLQNILQSDALASFVFHRVAFTLAQADETVAFEDVDMPAYTEQLLDLTEDTLDEVGDAASLLYVLAAVIILFLLLAIVAAVTHICNKGRWVKYLLLVLVLLIVVGTCLLTPILSDVMGEVMADTDGWDEISLRIAAAPFFSVILMIAPIVLDIIFERKKEIMQVEG